jgi:hypothetical protein
MIFLPTSMDTLDWHNDFDYNEESNDSYNRNEQVYSLFSSMRVPEDSSFTSLFPVVKTERLESTESKESNSSIDTTAITANNNNNNNYNYNINSNSMNSNNVNNNNSAGSWREPQEFHFIPRLQDFGPPRFPDFQMHTRKRSIQELDHHEFGFSNSQTLVDFTLDHLFG